MEAETKTVEQVAKTWPEVADKALEGLQHGIGEVAKVVQNIASELTQAAPQIWHGLVEYHRWLAIGELATHTIYIAIFVAALRYSIKIFMHYKKNDDSKYYSSEKDAGMWLSFIAGVVATIFILVFLNDFPKLIGDVAVPERAAAIEIIKVVKTGGKIEELEERQCNQP